MAKKVKQQQTKQAPPKKTSSKQPQPAKQSFGDKFFGFLSKFKCLFICLSICACCISVVLCIPRLLIGHAAKHVGQGLATVVSAAASAIPRR